MKTKRITLRLRLEEIEGATYTFTDETNGARYYWLARGTDRPILLEGALFDVTGSPTPTLPMERWHRLLRCKFTQVSE